MEEVTVSQEEEGKLGERVPRHARTTRERQREFESGRRRAALNSSGCGSVSVKRSEQWPAPGCGTETEETTRTDNRTG